MPQRKKRELKANTYDSETAALNKELINALNKIKLLEAELFANSAGSANSSFAQSSLYLNTKDIQQVARSSITGAIDATRKTVSFQIGKAVVSSVSNPLKMISLPITILRILLDARKREKNVFSNDIKNIIEECEKAINVLSRKNRALSLEGILTCNNTSALHENFWLHYKVNDLYKCLLIISRLEALSKDEGYRSEEKYIEKYKSKLPAQLFLFEMLADSEQTAELKSIPGNICYLLHNSLPISSGGYSTRAHGLATSLTKIGYSVICITRPGFPLDNLNLGSLPEAEESEEIDGVSYERILRPTRKDNEITRYLSLAADSVEARLRKHKPELVIAASNYYTALPALIASKRLGIPFIYEVRGFWEITRLSRDPSFAHHISYSLQRYMEGQVCQHSDNVITLNKAMREELVNRGVDRQKIHLLPNACNPEDFAPRDRSKQLADKHNIPNTVPVIGYIGSFVQYEGLDDLAKACGILKQRNLSFRLVIVGNEDVSGDKLGPIATEILEIAKDNQFDDWLIMPGRVQHFEVPNYYSLIDIAPFPRKPQPVTEMVSPMKIMEAMAMGKAVVASNVSALDEIIEDKETGLTFEKGSVVSLADALHELLLSSDLRNQLGEAAKDYVSQKRTWTSVAEKADSIFKETIRKRSK